MNSEASWQFLSYLVFLSVANALVSVLHAKAVKEGQLSPTGVIMCSFV